MRNALAICACALLPEPAGIRKTLWRRIGDPQYQLGYEMGHAGGVREEQTDLCRRIESYNTSIANVLTNDNFCPKTSEVVTGLGMLAPR
jgi:hypothetical protein